MKDCIQQYHHKGETIFKFVHFHPIISSHLYHKQAKVTEHLTKPHSAGKRADSQLV